MLEGDTNAVRLDAVGEGRRHFTREKRVFGVVLEIAATKGIAHYIHTGAEKDIDAVIAALLADYASECRNNAVVPC